MKTKTRKIRNKVAMKPKKIASTKKQLRDYLITQDNMHNAEGLLWQPYIGAKKICIHTNFNKHLCWGLLGREPFKEGMSVSFGNYNSEPQQLYKFVEVSLMTHKVKIKIILDFMKKPSLRTELAHAYDYVGDEDAYIRVYGRISKKTQQRICINLMYGILDALPTEDPYANMVDYFLQYYNTRISK